MPNPASLDAFTRGYIEAALFTEEEDLREEIGRSPSFHDFAAETLAAILEDCRKFQVEHEILIRRAFFKSNTAYTAECAGRDFWYTRNGHGVGFWDRGLGDIGDALSAACGFKTAFPDVWLYSGDDGKIYIS
jgi:hypothetical protein